MSVVFFPQTAGLYLLFRCLPLVAEVASGMCELLVGENGACTPVGGAEFCPSGGEGCISRAVSGGVCELSMTLGSLWVGLHPCLAGCLTWHSALGLAGCWVETGLGAKMGPQGKLMLIIPWDREFSVVPGAWT